MKVFFSSKNGNEKKIRSTTKKRFQCWIKRVKSDFLLQFPPLSDEFSISSVNFAREIREILGKIHIFARQINRCEFLSSLRDDDEWKNKFKSWKCFLMFAFCVRKSQHWKLFKFRAEFRYLRETKVTWKVFLSGIDESFIFKYLFTSHKV